MRIFLAGIVLFLVGCTPREERPPVVGWVYATGESMLPSFPDGALVETLFGFPYKGLKTGDTVLSWDYARGPGKIVHHRIAGRGPFGYRLQGDNPLTNPTVDESWLTEDTFIGKTTGRHTQILVGSLPVPP